MGGVGAKNPLFQKYVMLHIQIERQQSRMTFKQKIFSWACKVCTGLKILEYEGLSEMSLKIKSTLKSAVPSPARVTKLKVKIQVSFHLL